MKISIGNDHAGPDYKKAIVHYLESLGHEVTNYGTDSEDSVDYPDFGHPVANDVEQGKADFEAGFQDLHRMPDGENCRWFLSAKSQVGRLYAGAYGEVQSLC